jgi:adenylate kinase family enzyme
MRIVVVGTPGSGKTTIAAKIAAAFDLTNVELDAIRWGPQWQALSATNPDEFVRRVAAAISGDEWVVDGNYGVIRDMAWRRATHLVWLDYERPIIMYRVIKRSFDRAFTGTVLWAGNTENWRNWFRPSHPIPWAWTTWRQRRAEYAELVSRPEYQHLAVLRLRRPKDAETVIEQIKMNAASAAALVNKYSPS